MTKKDKSTTVINQGPMGFVLFMAYFGPVYYFIQQSSDFWGVIGAFFKAIVWPAIVTYNVFEILKV